MSDVTMTRPRRPHPDHLHTLAHISTDDVDPITVGAALLGTGGGGDPHIGGLLAAEAIRRYGPVEVVGLDAVPDDAVVLPVALMGAPTVVIEKIPSADQLETAIGAMARYLGTPPTHIACIEAGGINSMLPAVAAARLGLPLIDGDGMGRAFPEIQMVLPTLSGIPAGPLSFADEKGNTGIVDSIDNSWAERLTRPLAVQMGSSIVISCFPMSGAAVRDSFVPDTLSLCHELGILTRSAVTAHTDPVTALADRLGGSILLTGKVIDVRRETVGGFVRGEAFIEGIGDDDGRRLTVGFRNENLVATVDGTVVCTTPDLIILVDDETGAAITTEAVRYGQRVRVLSGPSDERWHSVAGVDLVGPRRFGYDVDVVRSPAPPSTVPAVG